MSEYHSKRKRKSRRQSRKIEVAGKLEAEIREEEGRQVEGKWKVSGRQARGRQTGGKCGEDEDKNMCQVCRGNHDDDDEEAQEGWIGCDERGCWRWYHYWCVGQLEMPDPKIEVDMSSLQR